jgi:hypothetical protein
MTKRAMRYSSGQLSRRPPADRNDQSRTAPWQNQWAICAVLAIATLALYSPVRSYDFVDYDDGNYVSENPHVLAGLSWATIRWSLESIEHANWHPVTWLSHILDCQFYGLNAGGHHITSLLIHVLNVILLFLLLRRVSGESGQSFMVGAIFALHPFNVESVVWIAERKNVLSTLFLLLTLAAYGWYARRPDWKRYGLATLLFALGLASKPMLVTLPFLLLLLDYWPLRRVAGWTNASNNFPVAQFSASRLVLEKVPIFFLSAASSVITMIAQWSGGALYSTQLLPLRARVENALWSYAAYVWKTVWPSGFAVHYPNLFDPSVSSKPTALMWFGLLAGVLMLAAITALAWWQRRTRPYLLIGWLWYLGTLVPVIGIVQVGMQGMADRYAYVPLIGIFVMLIWGVAGLAHYAALDKKVRWSVCAAVLLALAILSFRQIGRWESNYALWLHTAEVTRENFLADDHLGLILQQTGGSGAMSYFEDALRIAPWDPVSRYAVAMNLEDQGLHQQALREYETVIARPMTSRFLALSEANAGIIYGELGEFEKSRESLLKAEEVDSSVIESLLQDFSQSAAARPASETYLQMGILLQQTGRKEEARTAFEKVLSLDPGSREAPTLLNHLKGSTH